jgi:hypothetical protein
MTKESALSPGPLPKISLFLWMDYSFPLGRGQYMLFEIRGKNMIEIGTTGSDRKKAMTTFYRTFSYRK